MLIHLVHDDKFIDMALREFEAVAPGRSLPIMLSPARPLKHVRTPGIRFVEAREALALLRSAACEGVILHSLQGSYLRLLRELPRGKQVAWLGWGGDYYDGLLAGAHPGGTLLPQTAQLERDLQGSGWRRLPRAARRLAGRLLLDFRCRRALPRVDIFAPVLEPEHALARRLNPWFTARYLRWNYGTLEDDLLPEGGTVEPGGDILVGNSAFPTNNHLEAFRLLKEGFDVQGRRIVVPLSYGDARYAERVSEAGRRFFGAQFQPMTDFLAKDAYIRVLDACGFVVMNHVRQQALGNIYIMMAKGARIFLRPENPVYSWLSAQGAHLDPIGAAGTTDMLRPLVPLSPGQRQGNAELVRTCMGRDVQRTRTRRLVRELLGDAPDPSACNER